MLRTMSAEPRKRVFISSTPEDLLEHCNRVIERLHGSSVDSEAFSAHERATLAECRSFAASADALLVVIGKRTTWIPEEEEGGDGQKSLTHWEAEAARGAGVPVFVFLRESAIPQSDSDAEEGPPKSHGRVSLMQEVDRVLQGPRLEALTLWLAKELGATPETFSTPDDLAEKVSARLAAHWAPAQATEPPSAGPSTETAPSPAASATEQPAASADEQPAASAAEQPTASAAAQQRPETSPTTAPQKTRTLTTTLAIALLVIAAAASILAAGFCASPSPPPAEQQPAER